MIDSLSRKVRRRANGWVILALLAAQIPFNVYIFPNSRAALEAQSGGIGPIDPLLFYTPGQVYAMVAAYGEEGRAAYRILELTADIVYPILYSSSLAFLIAWLFQRGFSPDSRMQILNLAPFVGAIFDLLENLSIAAMLTIHPSSPAALAWTSAVFTLLKWTFAAASLVLVVVGLVAAARSGCRKQA